MKTVKIGLLGCGTVGSGVVEILRMNADLIAERCGARIEIEKIFFKNHRKHREPFVEDRATYDIRDVVMNPSIDIVVELAGKEHPAYEFIVTALQNGKHVVTANKDVMALHGCELETMARDRGVRLMYEASVCGAIPVMKALTESLSANKFTKISGIVNGTSNYILSKMTSDGADFYETLAEAQRLGFAEADPESDIDGLDAARKIIILAAKAFGVWKTLDEVQTTGIRHISAASISDAKAAGCVYKLIAQAECDDRVINLSVEPRRLPFDHPLAVVNDTFNAVFVEGNACGSLMFYGRGAGALPTGSAVVGDIMEIAKAI
ncbi:MAG: homoserine dehydrogenase [Negativicutes bacterium]|jgi:homoserine dehydrogenase